MSLDAKLVALVQEIGPDIKRLTLSIGDLTSLTSTNRTSLVRALNEIIARVAVVEETGGGGSNVINDALTTALDKTWSIDKINATLKATVDDLIGGSSEALDTLKELAEALGNDPNFATTIAAELANRVRFDAAQAMSQAQQTQARTNIAAASESALQALVTGIGNTETDYLAIYTAAKA